ncbi:MerR family transcriptional regulator [Risungbinella massiliensis]|uniref:MerR family transcriptional regulator n=1 Tax=Risungbinella massiliensis TaxID=1329796 RepID=UPI0005CC5666|nr:MerR family transcriptional regulator [Risungbinella massiliensis]
MNGISISKVAKLSTVSIETVRYYGKRGLISEPPRTKSGYRMFPDKVVEEIKFIKQAQNLGFTLSEIKLLLSLLNDDDNLPIEQMYQFATTKVQEIEDKINQLNNFKSLLEQATNHPISELPLPKNQCPIIKKLSDGGIENG